MMRIASKVACVLAICGLCAVSGYAQIAPAPANYSCEISLYSEGFEAGIPAGWTVKTSNYSGSLRSYSATAEGWLVHSGPTATPSTGPSGAYEGSFYVYCEGSGPVAREDTASLTSPMITLNTNADLSLSFYTNLYGPTGQAGSLGVYVLSGGTKITLLAPIPSNTHSAGSSTTWEQVYLDLNAFSGQTIQLIF